MNWRARRPVLLGGGLLLGAMLALGPLAAVPTSARARLEQLARLPQVSFRTGLDFHPVRGHTLILPRRVPARVLEELGRRLQESPDNPAPYAELAQHFARAGDRRAAEGFLARAAALYHQQGAEDSADPEQLTAYAELLRELGRGDEAERLLRRAVQAAPDQWLPHARLAVLLSGRALGLIHPTPVGGSADSSLESLLEAPAEPPEPAHAERARRLLTEALAAADRAVALGDDRAGAYRTRATVRTNHRWVETRLNPRASPAEPAPLLRAVFHPDALPDLRRAVELASDDPEALGCLALLEVLTSAARPLPAALGDLLHRELWPALSDPTRARVRAALTELERLGQDAEPARASAALGVAGLLQFFLLGDDAGGLGSLRRAVVLDPDNEGAWEVLTFALAFAREYDELLEVSRQRVAHHDSPRNRLLLAKALEKNQQLDAMYLEAERFQARYPEDPLANLTLAAALLKVDRSETGRARALQHLGRASRRTGEKPPPELAIELLYQRGLWFALEGQIERARTQFRGVLELAPGHPDAAAALNLLEQLGEAAD